MNQLTSFSLAKSVPFASLSASTSLKVFQIRAILSITAQSFSPGLRLSKGSSSEVGRSETFSRPPHLSIADAMTASFSTGFMLHVEYTTRPPTFNICKARTRIRTWVTYSPRALPGVQSCHRLTFFLVVPSPEHGTSARIRSNLRYLFNAGCSGVGGSLIEGYMVASWFVTIRLGEDRRFN